MINLSNRQQFSVVCTLIDNGKLADQVAKFLPVVVKKKIFFRRFGVQWARQSTARLVKYSAILHHKNSYGFFIRPFESIQTYCLLSYRLFFSIPDQDSKYLINPCLWSRVQISCWVAAVSETEVQSEVCVYESSGCKE